MLPFHDFKLISSPSPDAQLTSATATISDMGIRQIDSQWSFPPGSTPDFSSDWVIEWRGDRYIHSARLPEAEKSTDSLSSIARLTFTHEAIVDLRRYWFVNVITLDSGKVVADKFVTPISLTLPQFSELLAKVLSHYFGTRISCRLDPDAARRASATPVTLEISYTYIWDLLQKLYDYYGERWSIIREPQGYVILIGAPATELSHIFEYGFDGGLLKVSRQPQSLDIKNKIFGRGGDKNLPARYFKDVDPQNPSFPADPDWIPELRYASLTQLRGSTFRSYIQGWKSNPRRQLSEADGTPIRPYPGGGSVSPISVEVFDSQRAAIDEPYRRGHSDSTFDPIEYVKDEASISKYGELWAGTDNEEIYPTIQGISAPWGDLGTAFAVEPILSDDVAASTANDAQILNLPSVSVSSTKTLRAQSSITITAKVPGVYVRPGMTGVFSRGSYDLSVYADPYLRFYPKGKRDTELKNTLDALEVIDESITAHRSGGLGDANPSNLPGGADGSYYDVYVSFTIRSTLLNDETSLPDGVYVTLTLNSPKLTDATPSPQWGNTFDVWIGDIWNMPKLDGESDADFATRVWRPILGDSSGNQASLIFLSGELAASEDYEFPIVNVAYDTSVAYSAPGSLAYPSFWRLTLAKSDADLDALGVYVPSTHRQARAGDLFAFINIDMPHIFVTKAEQRLDDFKTDQLSENSEITPTWEVELDKVRLNQLQPDQAQTLISQLTVGSKVRLADKRFITDAPYTPLYLQQLSFEYSDDSLFPKVSMTLSDKVAAVTNPVSTIQGDISEIHRQINAIGSLERTFRSFADKVYLRKDGVSDRSISPTQFDSMVSSSDFSQGFIGGKGFAIYRDSNGRAVLEADRLVARDSIHVNSFAVNEVTVLGGKIVWTAASLRVSSVESVSVNDTYPGYRCYFDQKGGSLKNQFQGGDIAYCERFDANLKSHKLYKAVVFDAGPDYIDIYAPDSGDKLYFGNGAPAEGDSIAQFGNTSDPERRYAIVVDVIGGGYIRFIADLDSVSAQGREYGFFGRQSTSGERMFIGSDSGFVEFANGKLRVLGDFHVSLPDGTSTPMSQYINSLIADADEDLLAQMQAMLLSGRNLVLNTNQGHTGFTANSGISDFTLSSSPMGPYNAQAAVFFRGESLNPARDFEVILVDFRPQLITKGYTYNISFDYAIIGAASANFMLHPSFSRLDSTQTLMYFNPQFLIADGATHHFESVSTAEAADSGSASSGQYLYLNFVQGRGQWSKLYIWNLRVGEGTDQAPWAPAPEDVDLRFGYLTNAFQSDTSISGGLIQSSLVRLGYRDSDGKFIPMAGLNGVADSSKPGNGIALFAGGDIIDKAENPDKGAMAAIRMDGTAYFCGDTVRFQEAEMAIGQALTANSNGLFMVGDSGTPLSVQNKPIGISVDSIDQAYKPFSESTNGSSNYLWEQNKAASVTSLYSKWATMVCSIDCAPGETLTGSLTGTVKPDGNGISINEQLAINTKLYVIVMHGSDIVYSSPMRLVSYSGGHITKKGEIANIQNDSDSTVSYRIILSSNPDATDSIPTTDINTPSNPSLSSTVSHLHGKWEANASGVHSVVTPNQTRLGSDGFGAVWGSSAFFTKDGDILMRTGVFGLRLSHSGIFAMDDGINWHRIDLSQLYLD